MFIYLQMSETPQKRSKFEVLYYKYRGSMYRIAFSILGNQQDAEDAVQYAFMKIAENFKKISAAGNRDVQNYFHTIVRNAAIDIYRKKMVRLKGGCAPKVRGEGAEYDGENRLAACILKLPERQRDVLVLKYHYGYTLKEIAKMLGITYRNAVQIDQRAKAKLRVLCEEEGIEC